MTRSAASIAERSRPPDAVLVTGPATATRRVSGTYATKLYAQSAPRVIRSAASTAERSRPTDAVLATGPALTVNLAAHVADGNKVPADRVLGSKSEEFLHLTKTFPLVTFGSSPGQKILVLPVSASN